MILSEDFKRSAVAEALARGVSQGRIDEFLAHNPGDYQRLWNLAPDTREIGTSGVYTGAMQLASGQWRDTVTGAVSATYGHTSVGNPSPVVTQAERLAVAATLTDPWLADAVRQGRVSLVAAVDARGQSTPVISVGSVTERQAVFSAQATTFLAGHPGDAPRLGSAIPGLVLPAGPGQVPSSAGFVPMGGYSPIVLVGLGLVAYLLLMRRG